MVDTGAGLSIMTEKAADVHGLSIKKGKSGSYMTASGTETALLGTVDFTAQFGNWLEMDLQGVAV